MKGVLKSKDELILVGSNFNCISLSAISTVGVVHPGILHLFTLPTCLYYMF